MKKGAINGPTIFLGLFFDDEALIIITKAKIIKLIILI